MRSTWRKTSHKRVESENSQNQQVRSVTLQLKIVGQLQLN